MDPDGDALSIARWTNPFRGSLEHDEASGEFTYTPQTNFTGTDTFIYTTSDGVADDSALVTITMTSAQDAPEAGDDAFSTLKQPTAHHFFGNHFGE